MDFMSKIYEEIGQNDHNQSVSDHLTTGILPLNYIISGKYNGGLPVGRITEIYGAASCGKTLMATMALIETQRKKGIAIFLDYEHAFDVERAKGLGLDVKEGVWVYKQPETAENGFEIIEKIAGIVRANDTKVPVTIIVDSVASMITRAEEDAKYDPNMKTKLSLASLMSSALKQLAGKISKFDITLIFLNQTRDNPGIVYGDKKYTVGGNSMKFYASVRIELSKLKKIENSRKEVIGEFVRAKTVKNKIHAPFKEITYISDFDLGVDLVGTHVMTLKKQGCFGSTKGWLEYNGKKYREKEFVEMCRADKKLETEILKLFQGEK